MIALVRTLSLGYVAQHRVRTALVVLSIALGVATLVATQAISRGLKSGVQDGVNPLAKLADLLVIKGGAGVPASLAARIRAAGLPGVADARPFVFARVATVELDNRVTWLFGVEMSADTKADNALGAAVTLRSPGLLDAARWATAMASGGYGVVTPDIADGLKKKGLDGTTFSLRNAGRKPSFLIVGTVDFSATVLPVKGSSVAVLPLEAASRVCFPEKPGTVQQINVTLADGADAAKAQAALREWLGSEADVQTVDASRAVIADVTSGLEIGMMIGSAGALVVGLFLVYNALSVSVAERRHDIGILRSVGATRGQVAGLFLAESLVMGLVGSSLGLPVGLLLAWVAVKPLASVISAALVPIDSAAISLPWWLPLTAVASGTLVAVLASLVPALQAAQEEPADAVRRVPRRGLWIAALAQAAAVVGLLAAGSLIVAYREQLPRLFGVFAGIVCLLLGALIATPLLAALLGRVIQPVFRYVLGLEGRLAADNLVRSPGRTGLVIAALAATSGLLVQTSGFLKSTREAITGWIEEKIAADLFVSCGSNVTAGGAALTMDRSLGDRLMALPGVETVLAIRFQRLEPFVSPKDGSEKLVWLVALDFAAFDRGGADRPLAKSFARLPRLRERGTVAVSENFAALYGVKVGDRIAIPGRNKQLEVEVVGTVVDYTWNRGTVLTDLNWFREEFGDGQVDIFDLFLKPGADAPAVKEEVRRRFGASEAVFVVDRPEVYREVNDGLNRVYSLAYAQQIVVGQVALLGVISALFISVLQRKRELGLLRAVGATRGQILRSVLAEAVLMGLIGAAVGFVIGLALEWYVIHIMIRDESGFLFPMRIPWIEGGLVTLACVACATLAGLWPAYLATTLRIPDAIAYE